MKRAILLFCIGVLTMTLSASPHRDFVKSIRYTPPPTYAPFELTSDPSDDFFMNYGPGFMLLANAQDGEIDFRIGLVGISMGDGKAVTFRHIGPDELKKSLEESGKGNRPSSPPVTLAKTSGLTTARWAGKTTNFFLDERWVQIETNIVLRITATAYNTNAFAALTNSLLSLKIDKKQLLESLQPKKPAITSTPLDKIEVGYMPWRGRRTVAFVFRSKDSVFSCPAAEGMTPDQALNTALAPLKTMQDLANQTNVLTMAFVYSARIGNGDGPDDFQTWLTFLVETNLATVAELKQGEYHGAPQILLWEAWTNRAPEAFYEVGEYKVSATLLTRKDY